MFDKLEQVFRDVVEAAVNPVRKNDKASDQVYREQVKVLKYVYALEDRVFGANLQQPAVNKATNGMANRKDLGNNSDDSENEQPIDIAVERLAELERRIERRYLKYPFVPKKKLKLKTASSAKADSDSEEAGKPEVVVVVNSSDKEVAVTRELEQWRDLVATCRTTAQLYVLVDELSAAIAWDKSIMKVIILRSYLLCV